MTDDAPSTCHIRSTLDDHGRAACLIQWGPITALLDTGTVLTTARDLMAAAANAECDAALLTRLRRDGARDEVIGALLAAARQGRATPPGRPALRIHAVAGAKTGRPMVHIARGSMTGELSPTEARAMATTWIETATAAAIDVRLRYALGEWDHLTPDQIERLFQLIQAVGR